MLLWLDALLRILRRDDIASFILPKFAGVMLDFLRLTAHGSCASLPPPRFLILEAPPPRGHAYNGFATRWPRFALIKTSALAMSIRLSC